MDIGSMNIKIGADVADAVGRIEQLKKAQFDLQQETKLLSTEYNRNAKELEKLTVSQKLAFNTSSDYFKNLTSKITALTERNKQLSASIFDNKNVLQQSGVAIKSLT